MSKDPEDGLLYHFKSAVRVGEIDRYVITYNLYDDDDALPPDISLDPLWLKIRNIENFTYRAAYLMGPYMLYCDVRTGNYHHSQRLFISADQPKFEPNIQPQQDFVVELSLHNLKKQYVWIVDVISQIIFTTTAQIAFEISIGSTKKSVLKSIECSPQLGSTSSRLTVTRQNTLDLWNLPQQLSPHCHQKEHLVILTHGLHSNVSTDMFYIKEQIEKSQRYYKDEQIIVKGFMGNICKTEKGVKYLGTKLAEYIVKELYNERIHKISFIGHSLGGPVQTFAIAYIAVTYPWFFDKVEPINFITLASPLLGIVTDNPAYVNLLLSFGIVGKTGQDLGLQENADNGRPLLYLLPGEPTKRVMKMFKRRTVYANATNDGIVPLYSAALLFLDYDEILTQLENLPEYQQKLAASSSGDFIKKSFLSPISKAINLWAPQKISTDKAAKLPKVSVIESAASVLIQPLPDKAYIMDPASRDNVILHDKIYTEKDIPLRESQSEDNLLKSNNLLLKGFTMTRKEGNQKLEEEIARRWHEGLSWRKVIVSLRPDAHNNIIVRRRFANAYGWPIVDHLIQNHFNGMDKTFEDKKLLNESAMISNESTDNLDWITEPNKDSMFDVGPTGMISTVGEMIDSFARGNPLLSGVGNETSPDEPFAQEDMFKYDKTNGSLI